MRLEVNPVDEKKVNKCLKGERGQAAVFISMILFTLVLFAALATNSGIVVNDRIRMQNTADLSSYAGAVVQAAYLNEMARDNRQIIQYVSDLRTFLNPPMPWPPPSPCGCETEHWMLEMMIDIYQMIIDVQAMLLQMNNMVANLYAWRAAQLTADANFQGTGNFSHISFLPGSPAYNIPLLTNDELKRLEGKTEVTYYFIAMCPAGEVCIPVLRTVTKTIDTWYYRTSSYHVYFPVRVKGTPNYSFLDIRNSYFGADATGGSDELWAYAVSKPYGGNIGTDDPGNCGLNMASCLPDYPTFDIRWFRDDYRARIVGIQEDLKPDVKPLITIDCVTHPVSPCLGEWMEH